MLGCPARHGRAGQSGADGGRNRPRRGRDPAPGRVRPMPSPGGIPPGPTDAGVHLIPPRRRRRRRGRPSRDRRLRGLHLDPGVGPDGPASGHRAGPIAELLGGGSELTRCPRHRLIGRAHWRPCPLAPPPWSLDAAAGSGRRGWPARRRAQQDACPWTCQRIARAYATGPLAPPHSSLCDPAFELWQHAAAWCCARSRELAAPP